ncbi:MAG: response regulator [Acidobacteria bacterium]|nr:response regulator [Acidobacteriota bacterium]
MQDVMRVLIVDDEPPARRRLRRLVDAADGLDLVGEAGDGEEAVRAIDELAPDLVFLDVQMPGLDGFDVLAALESPLPAIVFVTAFDEYALRAFDVDAVDYLLKPFDDERFEEALARASSMVQRRHLDEHHVALNAILREHTRSRPLERLPVKRDDTIHFVEVADIEHVDAAGNSSVLHLGADRQLTVRRSMKRLEDELPSHFVRVHRSHIVNTRRIVRLHSLFHGEFAVELKGGGQIRASRTHVEKLRTALGLDESSG